MQIILVKIIVRYNPVPFILGNPDKDNDYPAIFASNGDAMVAIWQNKEPSIPLDVNRT